MSAIVRCSSRKKDQLCYLQSWLALRSCSGSLRALGGHVMPSETYNGRSLTEIVADLKEETKEFVRTRVEMFKSELQEKLGMLKVAAPLGAVGALVLTTA